ncbi:MAG: mannitol dehydrogenase family protein [Burkholderiaceae bacterium]
MTTLCNATLATLSARGVAVPTYGRIHRSCGVVHLGLGAFHRAHQALVFDALLQAGEPHWGICAVGMQSTRLADALAAQDGLYAVQIADQHGARWQVCGAVLATCVAGREREQVVRAIAADTTRWITLTVTEKGYTPALADLLLDGLALRKSAGLPGLTIASCDNLLNNGRRLQALCSEAAALREDHDLASWVSAHCAFPNSMVDRIVPAATPAQLQAANEALGVQDAAALGTEAFWEWVIESRFVDAADADALRSVGVTVVDNVHTFEEAKLGLLNGSHSAIAYCGAVAGLSVVAECIREPVVHRFVHDCMTDAIAPHLSRPDWPRYRDALLERFANPQLHHKLHQIANDGSQKIPQRWVPSIVAQRRANASVEHLAFAAAAWLRFLSGIDERGAAYAVHDPMAATLQTLARQHADDAVATVQAVLTITGIWGDVLAVDAVWQARVAHWLQQIRKHGVLPAMAQLNEGPIA